MRPNLNVKFEFDRLVCNDEADGWGDAEPYMWTIFFKIDGTTCRLNDSLMLEGTATVFTTPGSHGNLNNTDVDAGDSIPVPSAIGFNNMILVPMPVPDFVKESGTDDVTAIAGCILVLIEEDNVTDDGAESGHRALNSAVEDALNSLIPTLGVTNQEISDEDINRLIDNVQSRIVDAVKNQQGFFENLWSWLNSDDTIGTKVWKFSGDELLSNNPTALQQRWQKVWQPLPPGHPIGLPGYWVNHGDWELFGSINTEAIPVCPADVVKEKADTLISAPSSLKNMQAMYNFRDMEMKKNEGLNTWWQLAKRNSSYLKSALNNKEVSEEAITLFKNVSDILNNRNQALSDLHFNSAIKILTHITTLNTKDRQSRKDIKRSIDALHMLRGKTPNEIFEFLGKVKPARYPSVKDLGGNIKLKNK